MMMMTNAKQTFALFALALAATAIAPPPGARAATEDLGSALDSLRLPERMAPAGVTEEKMYSVQTRYTPLAKRFQVDLGGSRNFTGSSFLSMSQADLSVRYHLTDRFDLGLSGSYGSNAFSDSAKRLLAEEGYVPDIAYVKSRVDLLLGMNVFYGKLRLGWSSVLYFDPYFGIGPGLVQMELATAPALVAEAGLAFWFGQHLTTRIGFKNWLFQETTRTTQKTVDHVMGQVTVGYLFGEGQGS